MSRHSSAFRTKGFTVRSNLLTELCLTSFLVSCKLIELHARKRCYFWIELLYSEKERSFFFFNLIIMSKWFSTKLLFPPIRGKCQHQFLFDRLNISLRWFSFIICFFLSFAFFFRSAVNLWQCFSSVKLMPFHFCIYLNTFKTHTQHTKKQNCCVQKKWTDIQVVARLQSKVN